LNCELTMNLCRAVQPFPEKGERKAVKLENMAKIIFDEENHQLNLLGFPENENLDVAVNWARETISNIDDAEKLLIQNKKRSHGRTCPR